MTNSSPLQGDSSSIPAGWKTIEANGLRFAYLEEGTGPLVLLIHGFPDTARTWDAVRPALAKAGYRAISFNTRGYWPTAIPKDGDYTLDTLARDVLALIGAFGEQSAIVIGHDWGAGAAYGAANLGPEKVRFLVTVAIPHAGALLRPSPRLLWGARHFVAFRFKGATAKLQANDFAMVDELVHRWSPAWTAMPKEETAPVKEAFRKPGVADAALGYYRAIQVPPPPSQRAKIQMPAAVFSGAHDGATKREDFERAKAWYQDTCTIVHMPGGHFLHREHPQRFIDELLGVLPKEPAAR